MESILMVIGVNCRTAPVAICERFWINEGRRRDALTQLSRAEGIDEVMVLPTCNRTEFILWTHDASAASTSVLSFLTREYGLRLCDWGHFYRKLDQAALAHVFGAVCGVEAIVSELELSAQVKSAWALAQEAGACGFFLNNVVEKALAIAGRVRLLAAEQAQAIVAEEVKRFQAELPPERARPVVAGTRR